MPPFGFCWLFPAVAHPDKASAPASNPVMTRQAKNLLNFIASIDYLLCDLGGGDHFRCPSA
jgi:hypothetical protein